MIKKLYGLFGGLWSKKIIIGSQILDFGSSKVLVHIPFHILIGFVSAFIAFLIFNDTIIGFACGVSAGLGVEGYQIFWQQIYKNVYTGFLQSFIDILEYILGAVIIFLI